MEDHTILQQTLATLMNLQDLDLNSYETHEGGEYMTIPNLLASLTPSYTTIVPPLNLAQLNRNQNLNEDVSTPPPRLRVDRWTTPVSVEYVVRGRLRHVKWFSDAQLAYQYVMGCVQDDEEDDDEYEGEWVTVTFDEACREMKEAYEDGEEGVAIAWNLVTRTGYHAYYEPSEREHVQTANRQ
jgi:hypothetical protein